LYHYLRRHPQVFMSPRKELHFFGRDITGPPAQAPIKDPAKYAAMFREAGSQPVVGEASPLYLPSAHAVREIRDFCPSARLLASVRSPADVVHSMYTSGFFPEARHLELVAYARLPGVARLACNAGHLRRLLTIFPREQVRIIVFDDLVADPRGVFRDICAFLDIDPAHQPRFTVHNRTRVPRFTAVVRALVGPENRARRLARLLVPPALRPAVRRVVGRLATRPGPSLAPNERRGLQDLFRSEVTDLGALLGRDLSAWSDRS
jgi:hypothetical protein